MALSHLELMFTRAWRFSFSKQKFFMLFPFLAVSGLLVVLCRTLGFLSGDWIKISLGFLPVFLISAVLLCAGILLTRSYHDEIKGLPVKWIRIIRTSSSLMVFATHIFVPVVLGYFLLWMAMGIFYLLKAIPHMGDILGALFSFGPFLLVVISLLMSLGCLVLLFLAAPALALKSWNEWNLFEHLLERLKGRILLHLGLFFLALLPVLVAVGLLVLGAYLTDRQYLDSQHLLTISLQWLFLMIPFAAILAPVVTFFFNFSAEAFVYVSKTLKDR